MPQAAECNCTLGNHNDPVVRSHCSMQIFIRIGAGKFILLDAKSTDFISDIKRKIHVRESIPEDHQRLIFSSKQLDNHHTLTAYNIQNNSFIQLTHRLRGGGGRRVDPMDKLVDKDTKSYSIRARNPGHFSVGQLKQKVFSETGTPVSQQQLYHNRRLLQDDKTLGSYRIYRYANIYLVHADTQNNKDTDRSCYLPYNQKKNEEAD